jgi:hypothetical protein
MNKTTQKQGEEMNDGAFLGSRKAKSRFGINPSDFKRFKGYTQNKLHWKWNSRVFKKAFCGAWYGEESINYIPQSMRCKGRVYYKDGYVLVHLPSVVSIPYIRNRCLLDYLPDAATVAASKYVPKS